MISAAHPNCPKILALTSPDTPFIVKSTDMALPALPPDEQAYVLIYTTLAYKTTPTMMKVILKIIAIPDSQLSP